MGLVRVPSSQSRAWVERSWFPGWTLSFPPSGQHYLSLGHRTAHLVFNSIWFLFFSTFYFSCFSENLAISFVSKRASSNHLDHILDPPKTVKSRTKSFWIPPLDRKKNLHRASGEQQPSLETRVPPAGAKQQHA